VALAPDGARGAARSAAFALPARVTELLEAGLELGDAVDETFGVHGSKRAGGAVGLLTAGALDRSDLYAQVVLLALMPVLRRDLYEAPTP
jgi:non-canonical (house-cleaning) NTP pyrophosphatase